MNDEHIKDAPASPQEGGEQLEKGVESIEDASLPVEPTPEQPSLEQNAEQTADVICFKTVRESLGKIPPENEDLRKGFEEALSKIDPTAEQSQQESGMEPVTETAEVVIQDEDLTPEQQDANLMAALQDEELLEKGQEALAQEGVEDQLRDLDARIAQAADINERTVLEDQKFKIASQFVELLDSKGVESPMRGELEQFLHERNLHTTPKNVVENKTSKEWEKIKARPDVPAAPAASVEESVSSEDIQPKSVAAEARPIPPIPPKREVPEFVLQNAERVTAQEPATPSENIPASIDSEPVDEPSPEAAQVHKVLDAAHPPEVAEGEFEEAPLTANERFKQLTKDDIAENPYLEHPDESEFGDVDLGPAPEQPEPQANEVVVEETPEEIPAEPASEETSTQEPEEVREEVEEKTSQETDDSVAARLARARSRFDHQKELQELDNDPEKVKVMAEFSGFKLTAEDLAHIRGFTALSEGQQRKVADTFKKMTLERIAQEGYEKHQEDLQGSGLVMGIVKNMAKTARIAWFEKQSAQALKEGDYNMHEEVLTFLTEQAAKGPGIKADGSLEFVPETESLGNLEIKYVERLNNDANVFANIPEAWGREDATEEQTIQFENAKHAYEQSLRALVEMRLNDPEHAEEGELDFAAEITNQVTMNRFMNSNPDVERHFNDAGSAKGVALALASNGALEKTGYMALGFASRTAAVSLLGGFALPVVAGTSSFIGRQLAKLRTEGAQAERDEYARLGIADETAEKASINDPFHLASRIERHIEKIENAESEEEREKYLGYLASRLKFTEDKINAQDVAFGTGAQKIQSITALSEKIAHGRHVLLMMGDPESNAKMDKRIDDLLGARKENRDEKRDEALKKAMRRGGLMAAGFASVGFIGRGIYEAGGVPEYADQVKETLSAWGENAAEVAQKVVEPVADFGIEASPEGVEGAATEVIREAPVEVETPLKVPETPSTNIPEEALNIEKVSHVVQKGESIWKILDNELSERGTFDGLSEGQKNFILAKAKNLALDDLHMTEGEALRIQPGQELDFSSTLGDKDFIEETVRQARALSGGVGLGAPEAQAVAPEVPTPSAPTPSSAPTPTPPPIDTSSEEWVNPNELFRGPDGELQAIPKPEGYVQPEAVADALGSSAANSPIVPEAQTAPAPPEPPTIEQAPEPIAPPQKTPVAETPDYGARLENAAGTEEVPLRSRVLTSDELAEARRTYKRELNDDMRDIFAVTSEERARLRHIEATKGDVARRGKQILGDIVEGVTGDRTLRRIGDRIGDATVDGVRGEKAYTGSSRMFEWEGSANRGVPGLKNMHMNEIMKAGFEKGGNDFVEQNNREQFLNYINNLSRFVTPNPYETAEEFILRAKTVIDSGVTASAGQAPTGGVAFNAAPGPDNGSVMDAYNQYKNSRS